MKLFTLISLIFTLPINFSIIRYNYSYYGEVIHSAPGLSYAQTFSDRTLGVDLVSPEDLVVYDDEIYLISSGSNALAVVNDNFALEHYLKEFLISEDYRNYLFETAADLEDTFNLYKLVILDGIQTAGNEAKTSINLLEFLPNDRKTHFNEQVDQLIDDHLALANQNYVPTQLGQLLTTTNSGITTIYNEAKAENEATRVNLDLDATKPIPVLELVTTVERSEVLNILEPLTLNTPMGLDVAHTGIYIADTNNNRILKLNHDFEVIEIFQEIDDVTFDELDFMPLKITTDSTGRMYVVARDVFEGIIELDTDGSFNRFTGVNPITLSPIDIFNRFWMSDEQIDKLPKFLPTSYTNVAMSDENFIYATSLASTNNSDNMIQLINPKGVDVLIRNGYHVPKGDIHFVEGMNNYVVDGPSRLVDIAIYKDGIYTVLDAKRSRLFTYDSEGNLLYINGEAGQQLDKFTSGVALAYFGDNLLVLDKDLRTVVVYEHTEFGQTVNEAIYYHERGDFERAARLWEEVLVLNTNYEVAYNGIGKYYLRKGDYETAMEYFKYGYDKYYYSRAYKSYRNQLIKENFGYIFLAILALPTAFIVYKQIRKRKDRIK